MNHNFHSCNRIHDNSCMATHVHNDRHEGDGLDTQELWENLAPEMLKNETRHHVDFSMRNLGLDT